MIASLLGLPTVGLGGWLVMGMGQQHGKQLGDRLQSTLLSSDRSTKRPEFGIACLRKPKSPVKKPNSKQYLGIKAKEFNATFDLNTNGGIYYHFDL